MGDQRQSDVPIPAVPAADLVVVEPDLALGLLEADLHVPALAGDPRQLGKRRPFGREHDEGSRLVRLVDGATHQQPPGEPVLQRRGEREPPPVEALRSL